MCSADLSFCLPVGTERYRYLGTILTATTSYEKQCNQSENAQSVHQLIFSKNKESIVLDAMEVSFFVRKKRIPRSASRDKCTPYAIFLGTFAFIVNITL